MRNRYLLAALAALGLLLASAALVWQVDMAQAQGQRPFRLFAPYLAKRAFPAGAQSTLFLSIAATVADNGNVTYRVQINNRGTTGVTVLPLEFSYDNRILAFLSAQFTPDERSGSVLRWNDLTEFLGDLEPGGTKTFNIIMGTVGCPEGGAATFVQALVSGALDVGNQTIPPASARASARLTCATLDVTKTLFERPSGQAIIGDEITYEIVVTNPTSNEREIRGVPLADRFNPDILRFRRALVQDERGEFVGITPSTPITTTPTGVISFTNALAARALGPGQSLRLRVTFSVEACSQAAGTENIAEVGGMSGSGVPIAFARGRASLIIICPNIQIDKRVQAGAQTFIGVGEFVTFTIAIQATGNQPINVIPMQDVYDPTVLRFVSADPAPSGQAIAGTVEWDDLARRRGGPLMPGQTYTVTAAFQAIGCPTGGSTFNRARIGNAIASGGGYGFNAPQASDTEELEIACPRLDVTKRVITPRSALIQELGGQATFEIVVRNTGNLPLTTVPLTDTFDSAIFDFVSASIAPSSQTPPGTLSWANLTPGAPLQPGDSITILVVLQTKVCPDPTKPVTSTNRTGVNGARAAFRNTFLPVPADADQADIDVVCAKIIISKTLVAPPSGAVSPNVTGRNILSYRIDITNTGNITVTRLPLRDEWDAAFMDYHRAVPAPSSFGPGVLIWDDLTEAPFGSDLLPGEHRTLTVEFIAMGCPPGQIVRNQASIVGALAIPAGAGVPAPVPNVYASDDGRIACPRVEVEKRLVAAPNCDIVGVDQEIDFDIIIRNTGNSTLVHIPLVDNYEAHYLRFVRATPQQTNVSAPSPTTQSSIGTITWADLTAPAPFGFGRDLPPGESLTVRVTFRTVRSTFDIQRSPARMTRNEAAVEGARDEFDFVAPTYRSAPAYVRIAQADLFIEKVQETLYQEVQVSNSEMITDILGIGPPLDQVSNQVVVPGELITYTVRFGNRGPDEATFVRIIDTIPPGTQYVRHDLRSCVGRDIRQACFVGEIAPGETFEFHVVVRVPRVTEAGFSTPPGTVLRNTITLGSGFSSEGPTCGIPDQFATDNTATYDTTVLGEFGDAPENAVGAELPGYGPRVTATYNGNYIHEWLGRAVSGERGARDPLDPDGRPNLDPANQEFNSDFHDDGVLWRNPWGTDPRTGEPLPISRQVYRPNELESLRIIVSVDDPASGRYSLESDERLYITSWIDSNKNGVFGDQGDQVMFQWNGGPGLTGSDGSFWSADQPSHQFSISLNMPGAVGWFVIRTRLSYGVPPTPEGAMDYGEIEDHVVGIFIGYNAPPTAPGPPQPPRRP